MNHTLLKTLRNIGLGLFIFGFAVFNISLLIGNHQLTNEVIEKTIKDKAHAALLTPSLEPLLNKTYTSSKAFVDDFQRIFDELNNRLKAEKKWDEVIYTNYTFLITKNSTVGFLKESQGVVFTLSFLIAILGGLLYILPDTILLGKPGIKHHGIFKQPSTNRGWVGIILGSYLILFYIVLYFFAEYITSWVLLVEPISLALSGKPADQWFLYGFLYCTCMLVMGIRMFVKYRHSNYQLVRTASVLFFQVSFAFIIPELLKKMNLPSKDLKNIFPLDYSFFYGYNLSSLTSSEIGIMMLIWGLILFLIGVPVITYFYGKRWYCSWVCGCGGLAETVGDPFRQLSNKSLFAWKVERILVHSVLVFAILVSGFSLYGYFTNAEMLLGLPIWRIQQVYGFMIGAVFAGVVGTGFYPFMGSRVWCRFGCPLAAYLGIIQRFKSRFRITVNGGQCISCGNCSTYCEMGIDVRAYAQRGENIVRASCVGCGVCAAVCPRGVLNLENGLEESRVIHVQRDSLKILS